MVWCEKGLRKVSRENFGAILHGDEGGGMGFVKCVFFFFFFFFGEWDWRFFF